MRPALRQHPRKPTKRAARPLGVGELPRELHNTVTSAAIGLDTIDRLTGGKLGTFDVPCPLCGPFKRAARNQRRPVLRIYRIELGFAGFHCARCGEKGAAIDGKSPPPDPVRLAKARAEAAERDRIRTAERLSKAHWLWSQRRPIAGSIAETYLRDARGYGGPLPATLGFLPGRDEYPPAMIAAFGDRPVSGVHLTRLLPDGSDRERSEQAKIMIGNSIGFPIVLAPVNDLLGLAVAEGIESALSTYEATGLGTWAAGCASRLPALAGAIDPFVECVTIVVDDDQDGRRYAIALAEQVERRGIEARPVIIGGKHDEGCE
jgi:hypothetical protein